MANRFNIIAKFNPGYFAFFSGISISVATNILTTVKASPEMSCVLRNELILSTVLFFMSGIFTIFLSWSLEEAFIKWKTADRNMGYTEEKILSIAIDGHTFQCWFYFILGIVLFICGSITLLITPGV